MQMFTHSIRYNKSIKYIFKTLRQIQQAYLMHIENIPSDTTSMYGTWARWWTRAWRDLGPAVDLGPAGPGPGGGPGDPGPAGTQAWRGPGPGGGPRSSGDGGGPGPGRDGSGRWWTQARCGPGPSGDLGPAGASCPPLIKSSQTIILWNIWQCTRKRRMGCVHMHYIMHM